MKKALIITGRGVQDQEFIYPHYRLQEAGFAVTVAAEEPEFQGIQGVKFSANASIEDEAEVVPEYDVLVIPGGVKCMERLRLSKAALGIVATFYKQRRNGVIASICSGAQMLISAKLVKGREISAYYAMRDDIENAGGTFVDAPAVVCDRIVTSPHYKHLGPWMAAVLKAVA